MDNNTIIIQNSITSRLSSFLLIILFLGVITLSCSGDGEIDEYIKDGKIKVSISLANDSAKLRSAEAPNIPNESGVYSLEVLVFFTDGTLNSYTSVPRSLISVTGFTYDKTYADINEVKDIILTRGICDVYVVANAPDNYFSSVQSYSDFAARYETLSTQGQYLANGAIWTPNAESPISGYAPSDWKTNLTMCGFAKAVDFTDTSAPHFYLGYTENTSGLPTGITTGKAPLANNPFYLERLAARVAIKSITFELPSTLEFISGQGGVTFEHELDSVFIVNAKVASSFAPDAPKSIGSFANGNQSGYSVLSAILPNIAPNSYVNYLAEAIVPDYNGNYDIDNVASTPLGNTPLWFYLFENAQQPIVNPTYFVISVKYYFKDALSTLKMQKCYYPIVINNANAGIVNRNNQYRLTVTIKGLGVYKASVSDVKAHSLNNNYIEVKEETGKNLFPWTGNIYK